ncbi:peroxiredoxin [Lysinibacillus sp. BW-2-10]|uniref:peroxiredoxin family protein n=1 Tax=Lysinibacillus sp. BW-2-10 TaxID=2590030 RepID=UPI002103C28F|nr:redoxin domain-containing protein [Lysinibacillus sp. BW-2-10]
MKKKIIGLLVVIVLVVIMVGTYINDQIKADEAISDYALGQEMKLDQEGLEKGQIAPNFTLPTLDGETLTLADLKGKKVILNFWATWCPPCKEEMPHLQNYYDKYAEKDNVEIVAVNLTYTDRTIEDVRNFANGYNLTFPILLMEEEGINQTYQVLTIPSTFMIDSDGRIQKHIVGPLDQDALREHVKDLN